MQAAKDWKLVTSQRQGTGSDFLTPSEVWSRPVGTIHAWNHETNAALCGRQGMKPSPYNVWDRRRVAGECPECRTRFDEMTKDGSDQT